MILILFLMWLFGAGNMVVAAWVAHPILFIIVLVLFA